MPKKKKRTEIGKIFQTPPSAKSTFISSAERIKLLKQIDSAKKIK